MIVTLENLPNFAEEIIPLIFKHRILGLSGALGAGKTTLVGAILKSLGCTIEATSPTYTLQNIYPLSNNKITEVHHWDLYRLSSAPPELYESLYYKDIITIIEWPELDPQLLVEIPFLMQIDIKGAKTRQIVF
jgi:tRNA threonylcarbamoyladenosine biosynthesis protein TsaE